MFVIPTRSFNSGKRIKNKDTGNEERFILEKGKLYELSDDDAKKLAQFGLREATEEEVNASKEESKSKK